MAVITSQYGVEHSSIRIYIFDILYKSKEYTDEVDNLYTEVSTELNTITGFNWQSFKVSRVRRASSYQTEIHLDGCTQSSSDRLNSTVIDTLRTNIVNKLDNISNIFSYGNVDVITDRFLEESVQESYSFYENPEIEVYEV